MPIDFLFPKVYHLQVKDFEQNCQALQDYQKYKWLNRITRVIFLMIVAALIIAFWISWFLQLPLHSIFSGSKFYYLLGIFIVLIVIGSFSNKLDLRVSNDEMQMNKFSNLFRLNQTSFYIEVDKSKIKEAMKEYVNGNNSIQTIDFHKYNVYADICNNKGERYQYFIGQMDNGKLVITNNSNSDSPTTSSIITALNSYAMYIKQHHLESDFKNTAHLEFSTKYLDKNYSPMLMMKGKGNQYLHLKDPIFASADNVVLNNI